MKAASRSSKRLSKGLAIVVVGLLMITGYLYLKIRLGNANANFATSAAQSDTQLQIANSQKWLELKSDLRWSGSSSARMLNGKTVRADDIKDIRVVYTTKEQSYLTQQDEADKPIFAAVGYTFKDGVLTLKAYVDPNKTFPDPISKQWLVTSMAIQALDKIYNPNADGEALQEHDKMLFSKYKDTNIWTGI